MAQDHFKCTRCGRIRSIQYLVERKTYGGKKKIRCRAKSVCSSIARRNKEKGEQRLTP